MKCRAAASIRDLHKSTLALGKPSPLGQRECTHCTLGQRRMRTLPSQVAFIATSAWAMTGRQLHPGCLDRSYISRKSEAALENMREPPAPGVYAAYATPIPPCPCMSSLRTPLPLNTAKGLHVILHLGPSTPDALRGTPMVDHRNQQGTYRKMG